MYFSGRLLWGLTWSDLQKNMPVKQQQKVVVLGWMDRLAFETRKTRPLYGLGSEMDRIKDADNS